MISKCGDLLRHGEESIPIPVLQTIALFEQFGCWFRLSRNPAVRSCKEAAHSRSRLGVKGIPLEDELKSFFCWYVDEDGNRRPIGLHCRANHQFDLKKTKLLLGTESLEKVGEDELHQLFAMNYGIVNPFSTQLVDGKSMHHFFGMSLRHALMPPYTMMTNAGDLTWAIEFKPMELISKLPNFQMLDIESQAANSAPLQVGILTGSSPDTAIDFWQVLNDLVRLKLGNHYHGDVSLPRILIESLPALSASVEAVERWSDIIPMIREGFNRLRNNGAEIACCLCNFPPTLEDEIQSYCQFLGIEYVNRYEVMSAFTSKQFPEPVSVVTTWPFSQQLSFGANVSQPENLSVDTLRLFQAKVNKEGPNGAAINMARDLMRKLDLAHTVLVETNELSLVLKKQGSAHKSGRTYIHSTDLITDRIATLHVAMAHPKRENNDV